MIAETMKRCFTRLHGLASATSPQHAGVSLATASRVASGVDGVRAETRARVERAMRDLLYVPPGRPPADGRDRAARPGAREPDLPRARAGDGGARDRGRARDDPLQHDGSPPSARSDYVHMLLERGVDGMIFISCEMTNLAGDHDHYERLLEEGARLVFVNGALEDFDVPSRRRRRAPRRLPCDAST